jgi:cyclopropane-fatty-acyl-phospholipid synthase
MRLIPLSYKVKNFLNVLKHIDKGTLTLITPKGVKSTIEGKISGLHAELHIKDWNVVENIASRGDIGLGEDYILGLWDSKDVEALITLFLHNLEALESYAHGTGFKRLFFILYNTVLKRNSKSGSRKNILAHYDVGNDFYNLWLDQSMTYSSALYGSGAQSLEEAQKAKYHRILDKMGHDVSSLLEIGCGWGGFADLAAQKVKDITCLTISKAQHDYATNRLRNRAKILLKDYRDMKSRFDAIVSIEMFEAVGEKYWPAYFKAIANNLKKNGKAIVQTITVQDEIFYDYRSRSDFIRHYVFPGGMLPSLKRFQEDAAKAGLQCVEIFTFGEDYAATLREWLKRFDARIDDIKALGYNDHFIRNWRFYLCLCAAAFAVGRTNVAQIELTHASS